MRSVTVFLLFCAAIISTANTSPLSSASQQVSLIRRQDEDEKGDNGAATDFYVVTSNYPTLAKETEGKVYTTTATNSYKPKSKYDERAFSSIYMTTADTVPAPGKPTVPKPGFCYSEPNPGGSRTNTFEQYAAPKPVPNADQLKTATGLTPDDVSFIKPGKSYVKAKGGKEYLVLRVLGQGHFGAVYLGYDGTKYYAIKLADPAQYEASEYTVQKSLSNMDEKTLDKIDVVVKVIEEVTSKDGSVGFVMEFANGGNLQSLINSYKDGLPEALAKTLFGQLADGLVKVHASGVTLRDIKPSNILVFNGPDGKPQKVKFSDFGMAAQGDVAPRFIPPSFNRSPETTHKLTTYKPVDIFQMGLMLYLILVGPAACVPRKPSRHAVSFSDPAWAAFKGLYPNAESFIAKALQKDPLLRPTATTFAQYVKTWTPAS